MRSILIILVLAVLAVAGYWYYRELSTGPKFALARVAKAVHDRDVNTFEKYVDVESVAGHLVDQVASQSQALGLELPSGGGLLARGMLNLAKPQLTQAARREVQQYVRTGTLDPASGSQPEQLVKMSLGGLASRIVSPGSSFQGVKYVNEQGEQALVGLEITQPQYDTTMVLEVRMRDRGDYWQVTEITNLGQNLELVARLEKQRLSGRRR